MDASFKERLTGAVILVALVVLVVPALLTGPADRSAGEPPAASEPATPLRSYTIDLTEPTRPSTVARGGESVPMVVPAPAPAPASSGDTSGAQPSAASPRSVVPAPPAASRPPAAASGFAVQVGSFGSRANADRLARTLRGDGFAAFVTPSAGDRRLYRVRVGPVTGRAEAEQLAVRLAAARRPGQVVSHP